MSATSQSGVQRTSPFLPLNNLSHNVAPTYNQPVLRQVGDRNNQGAQDAQPPADAPTETPADAPRDNPPASPTSPSKTKPGDLIIQSMRCRVPLYRLMDVDGVSSHSGQKELLILHQ